MEAHEKSVIIIFQFLEQWIQPKEKDFPYNINTYSLGNLVLCLVLFQRGGCDIIIYHCCDHGLISI